MHKVVITSIIMDTFPILRLEVRLDGYDPNLQRKLNLMGYRHFTRGLYIKELRNPDEMKDRYIFNMDFLNRKFGKQNIQFFKYEQVVS